MQVVEQLIGAEVLAFCMYMVTAEPCNPELPFQDPAQENCCELTYVFGQARTY
jgi:hypothetical protein